jgi:hypothetical protein
MLNFYYFFDLTFINLIFPLFSVIIISSLFIKEDPQGLLTLAIFLNLKSSARLNDFKVNN